MVIPGLLRQTGDEFSAEYTNFPVSAGGMQGRKLWKLTKIAFAR